MEDINSLSKEEMELHAVTFLKPKQEKWARAMREDWDARARKDPFFWVVWRTQRRWRPREFFDSGERDYVLLIEPILKSLGLETGECDMLELGCGVGRMTHSLARRFRYVHGVDVSPEMIRKAEELNADLKNIAWHVTDGLDLPQFEDGTFDFTFSFLVFQHVPEKEIVLQNIGEMIRVLKAGGVFLFQYNGDTRPKTTRLGHLLLGLFDRWKIPLLARLLQIDTLQARRTWHGVVLDKDEITDYIQAHGATVTGTKGTGTPAAWCWGFKE